LSRRVALARTAARVVHGPCGASPHATRSDALDASCAPRAPIADGPSRAGAAAAGAAGELGGVGRVAVVAAHAAEPRHVVERLELRHGDDLVRAEQSFAMARAAHWCTDVARTLVVRVEAGSADIWLERDDYSGGQLRWQIARG